MSVEDMEDKVEFMPGLGAYLRELWKYHERVRTDLKLALPEFRDSGIPDEVKDLQCGTSGSTGGQAFPRWLDDYIDSIAEAPHLLDLAELENARARHIKDCFRPKPNSSNRVIRPPLELCSCLDIPSQTMRAVWGALEAVVRRTMVKVRTLQ